MPKKINRSAKTGKLVTKEFAKEHPATTVTETVVIKQDISPLTASFGQEDLNKLVDKINELVARVNVL